MCIFTESINQQIDREYKVMCEILLSEESYFPAAKTTNIEHYLNFLEMSLQMPYNRATHLAAFIRDDDGLLSNRMYPLVFLLPAAKRKIEQRYMNAEQLAACLEMAGNHHKSEALVTEPYER